MKRYVVRKCFEGGTIEGKVHTWDVWDRLLNCTVANLDTRAQAYARANEREQADANHIATQLAEAEAWAILPALECDHEHGGICDAADCYNTSLRKDN